MSFRALNLKPDLLKSSIKLLIKAFLCIYLDPSLLESESLRWGQIFLLRAERNSYLNFMHSIALFFLFLIFKIWNHLLLSKLRAFQGFGSGLAAVVANENLVISNAESISSVCFICLLVDCFTFETLAFQKPINHGQILCYSLSRFGNYQIY